MRTKSTDRYQVTCEIPHDSGMHEWVVEVGDKQIYIESAHEDAVAKFINDANFYTDTHTTPMDEIHSRLEKCAKEYRVVDTLLLGVLEMELREAIDREHRLMRSMARWIKTHDIYGHMAKELLDECKEVLNDDGEFLFGKPSNDSKQENR